MKYLIYLFIYYHVHLVVYMIVIEKGWITKMYICWHCYWHFSFYFISFLVPLLDGCMHARPPVTWTCSLLHLFALLTKTICLFVCLYRSMKQSLPVILLGFSFGVSTHFWMCGAFFYTHTPYRLKHNNNNNLVFLSCSSPFPHHIILLLVFT